MKPRKDPVTPLEIIMYDAATARSGKVNLLWPVNDIATDMLVVAKQLIVDLEKFLKTNREAPAKRIRNGTKALDTLGKSFRVQSIKTLKNGKN
jgi:hypothetical protein